MTPLPASLFDDVGELLRHTGQGCIASYFRNLAPEDVSFKTSPTDLVSVADTQAEALIREGLQKILPDALFIGEESYAADPSIITHLMQSGKPVWVCDPIDGTSNFVHGREGFGPMLALVEDGKKIAGWMYDVCSDTMIAASPETGVTINTQPFALPVADAAPLKGMMSWQVFKQPAMREFRQATQSYALSPAQHPSLIAYWKLLTGDFDFLIYKRTSAWDHLPGLCIVETGGGAGLRWAGGEPLVTDLDHGLIVARSASVAARVKAEIISLLGPSAL